MSLATLIEKRKMMNGIRHPCDIRCSETGGLKIAEQLAQIVKQKLENMT